MTVNKAYSGKARTPLFRGAFVRIIDPEVNLDKDGTTSKAWSITAILPAGTDITQVNAAIDEAATKCWGSKAGAIMASRNFRKPIKDGETQCNRDGLLYDGFAAGQITFKLTTRQQAPGIVDRFARPIKDAIGTTLVDKKSDTHEVIPENVIFSGCWFNATFCAHAYDRADGRGVSLKLENLQLVRQDQRLGAVGLTKAEDDFAPLTAGYASEADEIAALLS